MSVFGLVHGWMETLETTNGILSAALGYSPTDISMFGALFIIGGVFGSMVLGLIFEKKKKYRTVSVVDCAIHTILSVVLLFA